MKCMQLHMHMHVHTCTFTVMYNVHLHGSPEEMKQHKKLSGAPLGGGRHILHSRLVLGLLYQLK